MTDLQRQAVESLRLLLQQRSHLLFVLSDASLGSDGEFRAWYRTDYQRSAAALPGVLRADYYEQHDVDITGGRFPALPFKYLGIFELSIDGAESADEIIGAIGALHEEQACARDPATWLYFPAGEKVGRAKRTDASMLTIAFANGVPDREDEFREWYATRHIRHALNIPTLVSGQCFERTQFQRPGAMEAAFRIIAVYEQDGPPESIIEAFAALPDSVLAFPTLDVEHFAEWVYRPLED